LGWIVAAKGEERKARLVKGLVPLVDRQPVSAALKPTGVFSLIARSYFLLSLENNIFSYTYNIKSPQKVPNNLLYLLFVSNLS
jgi:hypothetical protein